MANAAFDIVGLDKVGRELEKLASDLGKAVGVALHAEANIEMTEAKRRCPVDTGALRSSGHVVTMHDAGRISEVRLVFGGPAAGYALYVHENQEAFHKTGRSKFLESTLLESAPYLAQRVAARMARSS